MLTSKKGDRNPKFHSKAVAARLIKSIARSGSVRTTKHAVSRMGQRDISMQDILCAFSNGHVIASPELDIKTNRWKYTITGNGIDVKGIKIITDINDEENYLLIITVMR